MALTNKVVIVDDSSVVRRMIATVIEDEPEYEVVGMAENGNDALAQLRRLKPDLVILDLEMPGMDGMEALRFIEADFPAIRVVVFANLDPSASVAIGRDLQARGVGLAAKPVGAVDIDQGIAMVRRLLLPPLRAQAMRRRTSGHEDRPTIDAVCVAVSTGGPQALERVFGSQRLLPIPIFVVQHISEEFSGRLAERLDEACRATVVESEEGMTAAPGTIYVAHGGSHLTLGREGTKVTMHHDLRPPVNSCRPSADVLFKSAAEVYGVNQLAVVLTGIGKDGLAGCGVLSSLGVPVLVQDESSSVVWGMPGEVAHAGLASEVVPLSEMGDRIDRYVTTRTRERV